MSHRVKYMYDYEPYFTSPRVTSTNHSEHSYSYNKMQMETAQLKDKMMAGCNTSHLNVSTCMMFPTELNSSSRIVCTAVGCTEHHKCFVVLLTYLLEVAIRRH